MHIHGGNMNPNLSLNYAHAAASAQGTRRAEETRRKLFSTATELDAAVSSEGAWMVTAWSGGGSSNQDLRRGSEERSNPDSGSGTSTGADEHLSTSAARPVSFWA